MAEDEGDDGPFGDDFFDDEEVIEEHDFEAEGWEELADDPEKVSKLVSALEGVLPDIVKRAFSAGMGGISASEERIRDALSDTKLPKEVVAYLLKQADSTKREFFRILSTEIREALEEMDFGGEFAKILTRLSLEARVQVRFIENEDASGRDSVQPKAAGKVRVREADEPSGGEDGEAENGSSAD